ncbi:MAG TPA: cytidine deaminase [Oceanipulchritudo sp.]|nr:cytidine deaminase [Oceanipulchritudo sp.]
MREITRDELDNRLRAGLEEVERILDRSYSPYSGFCVGAGLILAGGGVVTGVNYESASYGLTLCAERAAMAKAQSEGSIDHVKAVVLSTMRRDSTVMEKPFTPCGACRQWLAELAGRLGHDIPIYSFWHHGEAGLQGSAKALLPEAFL